MVWMHNLAMALPKLELAGNPSYGAERQASFDPMVVGEKKDEENVAGLILDEHFVGRL